MAKDIPFLIRQQAATDGILIDETTSDAFFLEPARIPSISVGLEEYETGYYGALSLSMGFWGLHFLF